MVRHAPHPVFPYVCLSTLALDVNGVVSVCFVRKQATADERARARRGSIAPGDSSERSRTFPPEPPHPSSGRRLYFFFVCEVPKPFSSPRCLRSATNNNPQLSEMNGRPLHVRQQQFQKESQYRNMLKDQIEENRRRKVKAFLKVFLAAFKLEDGTGGGE